MSPLHLAVGICLALLQAFPLKDKKVFPVRDVDLLNSR